MANREDNLDILKCGICLELPNIPKRLPCLHMFCRSCVSQHISSKVQEAEQTTSKLEEFRCPVCATSVLVPKQVNVTTFVSQLPTHHVIEAVISRSKIKSGVSLCGPCQDDDKLNEASNWCLECHKGLCGECYSVHRKIKTKKKHTVKDIGEMDKHLTRISTGQYCLEHVDKKIDSFCKDHKQPCCHSCMKSYHIMCHHVITLEEAAKEVDNSPTITDLLQDMSDVSEIVKDYVTDQETTLKQPEADKQEILKKIKTFRGDINAHLDKLEQEFEKRFTTMQEEPFKSIQIQIDRCINSNKIVSNCNKLLRSHMKCSLKINLFLEKNIT